MPLPTPLVSALDKLHYAHVWFRPLFFTTSHGYVVNILRVLRSGIISRHCHAGPVHAITLRGKWYCLEHNWWATQGSYTFETPGDIHTLEVPEGVEEMMTLFHVTRAYIHGNPDRDPVGVEDVLSQIMLAKKHLAEAGLGEDFVEEFIR